MDENNINSNAGFSPSRRGSSINRKEIFSRQIKDITKKDHPQEIPIIYNALKKPNQTALDTFTSFEVYANKSSRPRDTHLAEKSPNTPILLLPDTKNPFKENLRSPKMNFVKSQTVPLEKFISFQALPEVFENNFEGQTEIKHGEVKILRLERNHSVPVAQSLNNLMSENPKEDIKQLLEFCRSKNSSKNNDPKLGIFGTFSLKNMKEFLSQRQS